MSYFQNELPIQVLEQACTMFSHSITHCGIPSGLSLIYPVSDKWPMKQTLTIQSHQALLILSFHVRNVYLSIDSAVVLLFI
jgi:hypothetical protein